ncbi:MAG TPA: DUF177 domain-containing protein [Nitriliruptorales bacterium]|nr:DUF177 domain-containing protein [Nitriliruptorales bacterium]
MRIPVTDLVGRPGATHHLQGTYARSDFAAPTGAWGPGDDALRGDIDLDLRLEMLVDGLLVRGRVSFGTSLACGRCLADVVAEHHLAVSELFVDARRADGDDEVEVGYEILPEAAIDLESLVRDAVLSTVPLRVLCRPDCAGLCPVCGTDRNVDVCGHREWDEPDPRWAVLRGLQLPADHRQ